MLVVGGGIIGLEMATVYSTLGARIDVVEMLDSMMTGADRDLVKVWEKKNAPRFDNVMLKTKTVSGQGDALRASRSGFEGEKAPPEPQVYDLVLVAVGRSPNGKAIDAAKAGVAVTDRGFITVDKQMRTNVAHIFAIGDIIGQPMLAHKAVHEGHVAAEAAAGQKSFFDARQIPSVAYTDPEIAWAGLTEDECKEQGIKYGKAVFPWAASGRAIANGRDEGFTKLLFDEATHRCIGGAIVGTRCGRPDQRSLPRRGDGLRSGRHRQDDPSASDAVRIDRHGGRTVRGRVHRPAAGRRRNRRRRSWLEEQLRIDALEYHEFPTPGKISIAPTKALANQRDLSLAYSPGVAYACTAIQHDPSLAARYTARGEPGRGDHQRLARCSASATSARSPASR